MEDFIQKNPKAQDSVTTYLLSWPEERVDEHVHIHTPYTPSQIHPTPCSRPMRANQIRCMFPPIISQDNRPGVIILTNFRRFGFLRRRANAGTAMSVWSVADPSCIKDGRLSQTVFDKALCLGGKQYPPVSLYGAAQHPHRERRRLGIDDSNCHTTSTCHSHTEPRHPSGKDTDVHK